MTSTLPDNQLAQAALGGLRVIELGAGVAPAFAGRWLAAFGATVIKIEPHGGGWTRAYPPAGEPGLGQPGALALLLDAGKQSVVLDVEAPDERERLQEMMAGADLFIHDLAPAGLALAGLNEIRARHPGLTEVALTPFGSNGPYADYAATSIVLLALGGYQYLTGEPGREPLMLPGFQPEYLTGLYGVIAGLAGIIASEREPAVQCFEISMMEALASLHQFTVSLWLYERKIRRRHGNRWEDLYPITTLPCRDGYVSFAMPTPESWVRLCGMMERPDLVPDERFATPQLCRLHADELDEILAASLSQRDMAELFVTAQKEWRLALNPYLELTEVLRDPQYVARGFWVQRDSPEATSALLHPAVPVIMSETPGRIDRAPKLGEHNDPLRAAVAGTFDNETGERRDAGKIPATAPLAGLRVLDLTRVWSGPLCTRILADLGAEVVKIEPPLPPVPTPIAPTASIKLNRNKLSVGIDLNLSAGRDLLRRLATRADVLVENFSARVMPKFEFDYARLRELNPRLIYLAMSGYGTTGPYRDYVAYGSSTEAMIGLTALLGYPGEEPLNSAIAYPDAVGGLAGAAAILTALVYRARTGQGQFLDLSQLEATTLMLGEFFIAEQLDGQLPARVGNRHPVWAPHGTYRCRGEDEWISLAVRSDPEWVTFCRVTGLTAFGSNSAYQTMAGRRRRHHQIDALISAWTREQDKFEIMGRLQRSGIPAGALLNAKELVENPHLRSRGFFVAAKSPDGSSYPMPGTPIMVNGQKRTQWRAAPSHGEHNAALLKEILGLNEEEIEWLLSAGALTVGAP